MRIAALLIGLLILLGLVPLVIVYNSYSESWLDVLMPRLE